MHHGAFGSANRLEGPLDEIGTGRRENRHRHIVRNSFLDDQFPYEIEVVRTGRRIADFYVLETGGHQQIEHPLLAAGVHGVGQRLVAVAQINRGPDRATIERTVRPPP